MFGFCRCIQYNVLKKNTFEERKSSYEALLRSPEFFPSVPSGIFAVIGDSFVRLGREGGEGGVGVHGDQVECKKFESKYK
jgi:hypothetical protein